MRVKDEFKKDDSKCNKIKEELLNGKMNKRQIANKYKVDLAVVYKVANMIRDEIAERNATQSNNIEQTNNTETVAIEPIPEKNEAVQNTSKPSGKIDDDMILKIITMAEDGVSKAKIVKETGVSYSTVYNYCKEYGVFCDERGGNNAKKKQEKEKVSKEDKPSTASNEGGGKFSESVPEVCVEGQKPEHSIITLEKFPLLRVGLIRDRHPMPTTTYIFDKISIEDMFNYEKLEEVVNDFIDREVGFENSIAKKSLQVFITGLPCASAALIKVCQKRHVNLTLLHFNNDKEDYIPQLIWDDFGPEDKVSKIFNNNGSVSLFDCSLDDISNVDFYAVKIVDFNSPDKNN
ncbi:MAG: helix-turn-helix domain-containing protein, partial [Roseburia sp.]|nr:helix-turn-helix domain-containing protein [Roseburia sp.]